MGKKRKPSRNSTAVESVGLNSDSPFSEVEFECKRIMNEAKQGNWLNALNLISILCTKLKNSPHEAFLNRIQANVFVTVACRIDDVKDSKQYYENAVESAKRAVELSPNAIDFAHFYARLLFESAHESREYEKVVEVCERALAIEDIVDPITGSRKCDDVQSRAISVIKLQIRSLIQKSNAALVMRSLGCENEKFVVMPVRRIIDDKTDENQVSSMQFLLNKSHGSSNEVNNKSGISKGTVADSLKRKKQGSVGGSAADEMMKWAQPYWKSMSIDRKNDFLTVKIADLQEHIMSLEDHLPSNSTVEALSFCKENRGWHFMMCCYCNKKCSDIEEFRNHIQRVHLWIMPLEQLSVFPKYVDNNWVGMICDGSWEPLDLNAAAKVLEERPSDFDDKESLLREKWPVDPDSLRAELLGKIKATLDCHVKLQCLSESHINFISDYAITALQSHPQLLKLNVHKTHLCICFLGVRELLNILKVLQEITDSCEHNTYSGANLDDSKNLAQDVFMERIAFSQADSVVVSIYNCSSDNSPETDALLFSLYGDSANPEELPSYLPFAYLIEEKAQQGLQIILQLERDFMRLKESIEEKLELLGCQDALPVVAEHLCVVARKKIMSETDFQIPFSESVLRNKKEEQIKTRSIVSDNRFELNAMRRVLDEIESLVSDEVDDFRVRDAIQNQGKRFSMEIRKMDARILSIHAKRICLLQELASVSKHDFRIIVNPPLKSFLRARIEDLKKIAADELILDCKSNVGSGVDIPKLVSQRKKDSKKKRNRQKKSGPKVTNSDNSLDKNAKERSPPDDHVEECLDTDCHDLQLREEELKRNLELEAEERKLEDALERQRQMEYEAKQKSIGNQHDSSSPAIRQEETEISSEGEQLEQALDDQQTKDGTLQKHHVEQHWEKESCMQNDEFHNILEGAADNTKDGCTLVIGAVNAGVILTDYEQQPACGREPSHDVFHVNDGSEVDDWEVVGERKKHGKNSTKRRTNSVLKVTYCDNSRDETAHDTLLLDEKCPDTEMSPDTDYHDLHLEENERQLQGTLEHQVHMEHEAKQKSLANQDEISSTEIREVELEIASEGKQIQNTLKECSTECCMKNDKFHDTSDGVADTSTGGCTLRKGSLNRGAISTHIQQQPAREKEPRHGNNEPSSQHDSLVGHATMTDSYVKKGKFKWFNNQKGFGFVTPEDGAEDLFVHYSSIKSDGSLSFVNGQSVEYQVKFGKPGHPEAVKVTGPDGTPVQSFTGKSGVNGYDGGYGGRSGGGGGRGRCYTCGDSGRMVRDCIRCSGYGGRNGSRGYRGRCYGCGDSRHMVRDCMQHNSGGGSGCGVIGDGILLKKRPETSEAGNGAYIKVNGMDVHKRGLRIVLVERNSLPSVIIQSLWHIRSFRDAVQRSSVNAHVEDPFVACALCDILVAQSAPSLNKEREVYPLTVAIRETISHFFNKGPVDDASEVLDMILTHFHQVLMPSQDVSVTDSVESNRHNSSTNLFKLDVTERMTCYHCEMMSSYRNYTSFFHKINANDIVKAKLWFPTYSFDELLNLVEINHHIACDLKAFGCGEPNHIEHVLTTSPHVFTAFIEWQNNSGSCEDIAQILEAIYTSIDVRLLYRGLKTEHRHHLICMVCYYGQHYCCFGYNEDEKWIIHDDRTIQVVGGWKDVVVMCKTENMKPHVLFFEADTD